MGKRTKYEEHEIIKKIQKLTIYTENIYNKRRKREEGDDEVVSKLQKLITNYTQPDKCIINKEIELYTAYIFDMY